MDTHADAKPRPNAGPGLNAEPLVGADRKVGADPGPGADPGSGVSSRATTDPKVSTDPRVTADPGAGATRVVLAEDGVLLREGLTGLLTRFGFDVVAQAGDGAALEAAVSAQAGTAGHVPDLVITDIRMPPTFTDEGLRAAVRLRAAHPGLAVVVLSQYVQRGYAADLLSSGDARGVGYLLKDRVVDVEDFVAALRRVAAGGTVIDPQVVSQLLGRRRDPLAALSAREREVLALIAEGHSNVAIAARLLVTEAAVGKHVGNIFAKLALPPTSDTNRRVLAVLAYLGADDAR
jgi:DNA-binding NarL/FixJ family response regulator